MIKKKKNNNNKSKAALAVAEGRRENQLILERHRKIPIKSRYFAIGNDLVAAEGRINNDNNRHGILALNAYLRGSEIDGYIRCMTQYLTLHEHIYAAIRVLFLLYFDTQQQATTVLCFYWTRRAQGIHSQIPNNKRILKAILQGDDQATIFIMLYNMNGIIAVWDVCVCVRACVCVEF